MKGSRKIKIEKGPFLTLEALAKALGASKGKTSMKINEKTAWTPEEQERLPFALLDCAGKLREEADRLERLAKDI